MPDDSLPPTSAARRPMRSKRSRRSPPSHARAWSTPWPTGCAGTSSPGVCARARRLPSERELSLALGVNRLTLRASLARLEALGLIATRHGAGTVVASWRERAGLEMLGTLVRGLKLADPAWHDLVRSTLEIRRILAAEAVALAAERHTEEDIGAIAACAQVRHGARRRSRSPSPVRTSRSCAPSARPRTTSGSSCSSTPSLAGRTSIRSSSRCSTTTARASPHLYPTIVDLIRSRDGELARSLARRSLEQLDEAWSRRHPPPAPMPLSPPSPPLSEVASIRRGRREKR